MSGLGAGARLELDSDMIALALHAFHQEHQARFAEINGMEVVSAYGDLEAEYRALRERAGVTDLSCRTRLCVTGKDRQRFLHGQVTNSILDLDPGEGCYAALVTAKGRMVSDANIYCLAEEYLLDAEPGYARVLSDRLNQYIIADAVEVVDVGASYGLLSVQGPLAAETIAAAGLGIGVPGQLLAFTQVRHPAHGEMLCVNHPRGATLGFDLFVPAEAVGRVLEALGGAAAGLGGRLCGWDALERVRIEAGVPRFGADMDATTLPPEAGLDQRAISYRKGCYIGQEVIARIRTYGHVARALRGLRLSGDAALPEKGDRLFHGDQEVGTITSATVSPTLGSTLALGYVRREHNAIGTALEVATRTGRFAADIVNLPFGM